MNLESLVLNVEKLSSLLLAKERENRQQFIQI